MPKIEYQKITGTSIEDELTVEELKENIFKYLYNIFTKSIVKTVGPNQHVAQTRAATDKAKK